MTEMAAKGFTANQTIAAMPGVIAAAEASGEDLALAADTVASALNIFGLEASESSRVADVLAMTANMSAAGITDMQYALKYAGAPAAALGISMEELSASIGILTNSGLDGSSAGTSLRASLLALNNPAKAQAKIMEELGFSILDSEGKAKSLSDMIGDLSTALEGETDAQRVATLSKLVGTEAVSGFLALMKAGPAEIDKMTLSLQNSGGAAAETAAQMKDGIGGAMENLSGAFGTASILIGNQLIPYVQSAAEFIAELINRFNSLSEGTQAFITKAALVTAGILAIGTGVGVLIAGIGMVISAFATISGALTVLATTLGVTGGATGLLGAAFAAITGPIGLIVAAVAGIIAVLVVAYNKVWWFNELVNDAWEAIKEGTVKAFKAIKEAITNAIKAVLDFAKPQLDKFKAFWDENGKAIMILVKSYFENVKTIIQGVMNVIKGVFQTVWPIISETVKTAWETIKLVVSSAIDILLGVVKVGLQLLEGDWKGAWDTIKETLYSVWDNIETFLEAIDLQEIGRNIIDSLLQGLSTMGEAIKGAVGGVVQSIKDAFTERFNEITTAVSEKITEIKETTIAKFEEWKTSISEWFSSIPSVIISKLVEWGAAITAWMAEQHEENKRQYGEWGKAIEEWFTSIPSKISEKLAEWLAAIVLWFTATKESIVNKLGEWWASISKWFSEAPGKIRTQLDGWWTKIGTWFSEIPAKLTAKFEEWWTAIKAWFKSVPEKPEIKNMGKNLVDKVAEGNEAKKQDFMSKLGKIVVDVALGALAFAVITLLAVGREIISRIIEGVTAMKGAFTAKAKEFINAFKTKISETNLLDVGKNIVNGLIRGISNKFGDVKAKIAELANLIPDWAKKVLGIKSPSRVFTEIGKFTGMGLTKGLDGQLSSVKSAAQRLADASIAKPSLAYDTPTVSGASGGALRKLESEMQATLQADEASRGDIVLQVDGYEMARVQQPHLDRMQGSNNALRLYTRGK
ncbi:phage tail tape measure protein [Psychrobacillus psychrodurans]|uniref:phage tail tape measure protein n=1 Tax=Psychrobacillus psychrodurans TaxID=126157 RepID=UPI001F4EBD6E|nr:phage tail tape measure protein [Psychrobacillus psychrodurans]MCK1997961.1 phage tail tape measure protein [Psychrobacillus psychrodurans]